VKAWHDHKLVKRSAAISNVHDFHGCYHVLISENSGSNFSWALGTLMSSYKDVISRILPTGISAGKNPPGVFAMSVILTPFIRSTMVFIFFTITNPSECKNLQNVWPWMSVPLFFRLNWIAGSSSSALRAYRSLLGPLVQKAWTCTFDPWLKSTSDFHIGNSTYPMMVRHD